MPDCKILLVFPAFPVNTFWNLGAAFAVEGSRAAQPPLGLMTVAALLPQTWSCRLIDRNVSKLTDSDIEWADLVMTGGMNVQRFDCLAVVEWAQRLGKRVAVGGPDVSSQPEAYAGADYVICGEAEKVIDDLVQAWREGRTGETFVAEKSSVDVSCTPVPRFDLVSRSDYSYFSLQFSRGCPFTCEFCDIIELYGRVPRVKTVAQFIGELQSLYDSGYRGHLDFVDDNFIGNKKAVKELLPALIDWQRARKYPFWFSTEASLNLADDENLLASMRQANFGLVFVGIESPDVQTLASTQKKQNTKRRIAESVHRIQAAGIVVLAGFIVGFDSEAANVAPQMIDCISEAAIPVCMAGLLVALPNTQLSRRLARERRLFSLDWAFAQSRQIGGDQCVLGLNFETLRPRRDVLTDYRQVIKVIYSPSAYFARVRSLVGRVGLWPPHGERRAEKPRWHFLGLSDKEWVSLARLLIGSCRAGPRTLFEVIRLLLWAVRSDPRRLHLVGLHAAFYLHLGPFSRVASSEASRQIAALDKGHWQRPALEPIFGSAR